MGYADYEQNVYYNPEASGLEIVTEFDFSSGSYEFDHAVLWRRIEDGALFAGRDAGCSCPSPFESVTSLADLTRVHNIDEFSQAIGGFGISDYSGHSAAEVLEWERVLIRAFR